MSKAISREAILDASDLKIEYVDVPEWGGTVAVREMTGTARDAFEAQIYVTDVHGIRSFKRDNIRGKMLASTVCDDAGNLIFTEEDIALIGAKSLSALDKVFDMASRLNGIGAAATDTAEKNSGPVLSADSISA